MEAENNAVLDERRILHKKRAVVVADILDLMQQIKTHCKSVADIEVKLQSQHTLLEFLNLTLNELDLKIPT